LEYVVTLEDKVLKIENNCIEVNEIGTGFLMIKKRVFNEMIKKLPNIKYEPLVMTTCHNKDCFYAFFDTGIDQERKHYISEDYYFCKKWRDMGGKIYARVDIPLTHIGTMKYKGSFKTLLTNMDS
jgi:hypothetical protein